MPAPKLRDELARLVELEDDVVRRQFARRGVPARVGAATLRHPDELAVGRTSTALVDPHVRPSGSLK